MSPLKSLSTVTCHETKLILYQAKGENPRFTVLQSPLDTSLSNCTVRQHHIGSYSAISQKSTYLKMMTESYFKILKAYTLSHLQVLIKGFKQYPNLSLTLKAPLDLLDHMFQVLEQLARQPGFVAGSFSCSGTHSKLCSSFRSLSMWARVTAPNED